MTRPCPHNRPSRTGGGQVGLPRLLVLSALLFAPGLALERHVATSALWMPLTVLAVVNLVTYVLYARDKERARAQQWRISEATLQLGSLVGGWPAAFVAQQRLRHKCAKASFQFVFWLIVLAHQFVAIDSLGGWQMSGSATARLGELQHRLFSGR